MIDILRYIEQSDPDGWETTEPTDEDRDAFRQWVVSTWGQPVWNTYAQGAWEPRTEV